VQLECVYNFRDLGGLVTSAGHVVRRGRLYRSAELTHATEADMSLLLTGCGVRTVVDLRTAAERQQFGSASGFGERLIELPLLDEADVARTFSFPDIALAYEDYLRRRHVGERLVSLLRLLADIDRLPAVISCSAGKDRTGLAASAVLGALGVPDDVIADDYASGDATLDDLYAFWAKNPASTIEQRLRTHGHLLRSPRDAMVRLLGSIRRDFGSMRTYLRQHGATDDLFRDLDHALLEGHSGAR
jgi:protein-tyrosine phosphatase